MVFEPNYTKVVSSIRKGLGVKQTEVTVRLSEPNQDSIDSVLSVNANLSHLASSSVGRDVSISGLLDMQVAYVNANQVGVLDYTADFKDKYVSSEDITGELILTGHIVDVSYTLTNREIKISVILEINIDEIENTDNNILTHVSGDNIYVDTDVFTYTTYAGIATDKFEILEDVDIKNASNILLVSPTVKLTSSTVNDKFVSISGNVCVNICYKVLGSTNTVQCNEYVFDFTQEIVNDGINIDSHIHSIIDMVIHEMKVVATPNESGLQVNLVLPILYRGYIFNEYSIDVVKDVYSSTNYLSTTYDGVAIMKHADSISFSDKINGVVSILDTAPFIDEVVGTTAENIILTRSEIVDGRIVIEGVASVTTIYYSKEIDSLSSVMIDIPFVLDEVVDGLDGYTTVSTLKLCGVSSRSRRGKEIDVSAELYVYTDVYSSTYSSVITDVTLGDTMPFDDCVLTIYVVREGDTIWSIAKAMGVSVDTILSQNPDISDPLLPGAKIVIYKPRMAEFD